MRFQFLFDFGDFIFTFVSSITPPGTLTGTNMPPEAGPDTEAPEPDSTGSNTVSLTSTNALVQGVTNRASSSRTRETASATDTNSASSSRPEHEIKARKEISDQIHKFIRNTRTGTLGVTGGVVLVFAAIGMLIRIEETMNDIWGARRGRRGAGPDSVSGRASLVRRAGLVSGRGAGALAHDRGVRRGRGRECGRGGRGQRQTRLRMREPDDEPVSHPRRNRHNSGTAGRVR